MTHRGFIALTSVLIISAVMMLVVLGGAIAASYARMNAASYAAKRRSAAQAYACAALAVARLTRDPSYPGEAHAAVGEGECEIGIVETDGVERLFTVTATSASAVTVLSIAFNAGTLEQHVGEIPNP